jgi:hypothetical protein
VTRTLLVLLLAVVGCAKSKARQLDLDFVRVSTDARLRTDTVGQGKFEENATFVLVDADNTSREGAYITLGGKLADPTGTIIGDLRAQSLFIPGGETRTFALVDKERKPRPDATRARIEIRGAMIPASPPPYRIASLKEYEQDGKIIAQGILENDADRAGNIMVIASFHDDGGRPMTRPFALLRVAAHDKQPVQFVGPPGSKHGTIFAGESVY